MKLCTFIFFILATRPVLVCAGPKKKQKTDETSASVDNVNNNTDNVNSNSIALSAEYPDLTPTLEAAAAELNSQNPSSRVSYLRLVGRPPASFSSNTSATTLSSQHQQQQQHVLLNQQESNQISSGEVPQQQLLLPLGLSSPDFPQGSTHRNPLSLQTLQLQHLRNIPTELQQQQQSSCLPPSTNHSTSQLQQSIDRAVDRRLAQLSFPATYERHLSSIRLLEVYVGSQVSKHGDFSSRTSIHFWRPSSDKRYRTKSSV